MKKIVETQVFDLPLPNTEMLERNVLADAICSPELLGDVIPVVSPDFFTSDERREIWTTIVERYNAGEEIGFTLAENCPAILQEVIPYINGAGMSETPFRAQLLRDGAAKRRAYKAAAQFIQDAIKPGVTEQDIFTSVETLSRAIEGPSPLQGEKSLADVIGKVREDAKKTEAAISAGKKVRITTGFHYMDEMLNGGMKCGQLVILAARPSVGKTALMLQMARAAAKADNAVQIFSLEMTCEELAERLIYSTEKVRPYQINHGCVDWQLFDKAEEMLKPLPLYINDFSRSLDEITSRLTQSVNKGRCKVAYIDYLGLMQDALNFGNAKLYQAIARITGTLKAVAKRLEIPIVLLCQMNREAAKEDREPQLFDLRDSGSIEQDADVVMMLENKNNQLNVYLRKNRAGKKEIKFVFHPNDTYSAFTEDLPEYPEGMKIPTPPAPTQGTLEMEHNPADDLPF